MPSSRLTVLRVAPSRRRRSAAVRVWGPCMATIVGVCTDKNALVPRVGFEPTLDGV